ncbi:hypothetical protein [Paenibacillus sp. FSL E2-0178]|uniref:hypothetical protein n=1 Tax=Paenibacillus sp. FSL E2-0178 TaxID=2921361 RepID=UPI0031595416
MNRFFYVYDKALMKYLRYEHDFEFITTGLHTVSHDQFWQFENVPELHEAVRQFSKQ